MVHVRFTIWPIIMLYLCAMFDIIDLHCSLTHTKPFHTVMYGGPVGRGYEQRFESKNEYEQRSESKIAYGPRAKLRTVQEQNCVGSKSKIAYGPRAKTRRS